MRNLDSIAPRGAGIPSRTVILGFLSGVGYEGVGREDNPLNGVDANAVWVWIDHYCKANPLDSVAKAGAAFDATHPR
jgi:hypothetical protein